MNPHVFEETITITVVVATHNRPQQLRCLIEALQALNYPVELFDVVIIDDGSEPPAHTDCRGLNARLIRQQNGGPAIARNHGLRAATGKLVAFTDDDCAPHSDWLRHLAAAHAAQPGAMLGGYTRNVLLADPYAVAGQALVDHLYEYLQKHSPGNDFFTTSNLAADRLRLLALGGFDESFPLPAAEDRDLCDRWKATAALAYVPHAIVDHAHAMTLGSFLRQQFRYGRGARVLHGKRNARGQAQRVEGAGFYSGMFLKPFHSQPPFHAARTALLLLLAQVANTAGYLVEMLHQHRSI